MRRRLVGALIALALAGSPAAPADAQGLFGGAAVDQSQAFPLAIGPLTADSRTGEFTANPGDVLLRAPLVYQRMATLSEPLRIEEAGQTYELPAGQSLPYVPDVRRGPVLLWYPPNGPLYCLDSSSGGGRLRFPILLLGTTTKRQQDWARFRLLCLADLDADGRFDTVTISNVWTSSEVAPTYRATLAHPVAYEAGAMRAPPGAPDIQVRYLPGTLLNGARFLIESNRGGQVSPYPDIRIHTADGTVTASARSGIRTSQLPQTLAFPHAEITVLSVDQESHAAHLSIRPSERFESYELVRGRVVEHIYVYIAR